MGLKYYCKDLHNSKRLSSNIDTTMHTNISLSYYNEFQQSIPSDQNTYAYIHAYSSNQKQNHFVPSIQSNIYSNISKLSLKSTDTSDEMTYGKLINSTSITSSSNSDMTIYENLNAASAHQKSTSSTHIYMNFDYQKDRSLSTTDRNEESHYSPLCPIETKQDDIETSSNLNSIETVKKLEVNMIPHCNDKTVLYRTKVVSPTTSQNHPLFRQRRLLHHSKRRRRRSSTPFRSAIHSNTMRRQQSSNTNIHRPRTTHDQRKQSILHLKSVSNQLYNEIQQSISNDNQPINNVDSNEAVQIPEYPIQFHNALQHHIVAWYPAVTYNEDELIPQILSASENAESNQPDEIINKEDEEFYHHETFGDFLLRRPSRLSHSTSTSDSSTVISEIRPVRPSPLSRRSSGIALSLDKNDVDFIHDILQRTHGDDRVSNRITALREAYLRAAVKRNDLFKAKSLSQLDQKKKAPTIKQSFITSKIRDELERYDELPIHRRPISDYDSEDDDDDAYSINDHYRFHHRGLPPTPSTVHRILSFLITAKRQLQKSFRDIRSRILLETMAIPSNHVPRRRHIFHDPTMLSRHPISRSKTSHDIARRHTPRHSNEQYHRHHMYRTHSNTSHSKSPHQQVGYSPVFEQHSSHRAQALRNTPRQQRWRRID